MNSNSSYFWRFWSEVDFWRFGDEGDCGAPFSGILRSTFLMRKLCFLSIFTWGKLPKDKIISSIGSNLPKNTRAQLVAFLDVGKRRNLYIKHGKKSLSSFELHHDFRNSESEEFEYYIRFIPSEKAVAAAKKKSKSRSTVSNVFITGERCALRILIIFLAMLLERWAMPTLLTISPCLGFKGFIIGNFYSFP